MLALSRRLVTATAFRWLSGMKGEYPAESVAVRVHGVGVGLDPYCDAFAMHSCKRFNVRVSRLRDPDLTDPATAGALLSLLLTAARARFVVVEIQGDWRTRHAEVRLVDVVAGGWHTRAAFVDMPLGEAVALALLSLEDAPA